MTQTPRDWQNDMEMCDAATPGPWQAIDVADGAFVLDAEYNVIAAMVEYTDDTSFAAEARTALPYWIQESKKWREEALRKYPTPEAYEAACTALEKHRARADAAEAREQRLKPEIGKCLVAGNSLASIIMGYELPEGHEDWSYQTANAYFYDTYYNDRKSAYEGYETWLAWKAIMDVSHNLASLYPDTPAPAAAEDPNEVLRRNGIDPTGWTWHTPAPKEGV
ncbi:hypothetical protein A3842_11095 [Paenibacillus sp. P3E]|uniref:hypothetical protein n=1 Tax=Paenibacillus sp. P3E TaxID=1349435 RepID=UPI00093BC970|nr:hypothetical protein [Paenibacillus sp. P3E]OKP81617.1 hypothetical protein A3842_11095 [Paenibacillus sp. P3E]